MLDAEDGRLFHHGFKHMVHEEEINNDVKHSMMLVVDNKIEI